MTQWTIVPLCTGDPVALNSAAISHIATAVDHGDDDRQYSIVHFIGGGQVAVQMLVGDLADLL